MHKSFIISLFFSVFAAKYKERWKDIRCKTSLHGRTGQMPEAVKNFIETNDANAVREVQHEILKAYEKDISKYVPTEQETRINQVWQSIPSQLAKENKKFIYGVIKQGVRAKEYELAIQWLIDAGLIY